MIVKLRFLCRFMVVVVVAIEGTITVVLCNVLIRGGFFFFLEVKLYKESTCKILEYKKQCFDPKKAFYRDQIEILKLEIRNLS